MSKENEEYNKNVAALNNETAEHLLVSIEYVP